MRSFLLFFASLLLCSIAHAQVPSSFNYQSVVRDGFGVLINSQQLGIKISIVRDSLGGGLEYSETHSASTNANGLFSIQIGAGTAVSGVFDNIQWETGGLFYQVEIDLQGASNYSLNSFHSFTSVPYAQHAQTADSLVGFSKNSSGHFLGEFFGGGVIFHLWMDEQGVEHGLVVDTVDLDPNFFWSNVTYNTIGSSARSSYDGMSNSLAIVAQAGHSYSAASLCLNSINGGYSDWYLPSINELMEIRNKRLFLDRSLGKDFFDGCFWSSTEESNQVWLLCPDQAQGTAYKNNGQKVRAIRQF